MTKEFDNLVAEKGLLNAARQVRESISDLRQWCKAHGWAEYIYVPYFPLRIVNVSNRCLVTGNLIGTDTWEKGKGCICENCVTAYPLDQRS